MSLLRSQRGQIEKLLMFVAMIAIAAIAISFIRGIISRQDPCKQDEELTRAINPQNGCLDDLSIIASQCDTKYKECAKGRKISSNPMPCFTLSKSATLSECTDVDSFKSSSVCSTCCVYNGTHCVDGTLKGTGSGVIRFTYFVVNDTYGSVALTST
jgi:hypothetical protein